MYTAKGGRVKAQCTGHGCGWQTGWMDDSDEVTRLGKEHTGLKEREPKPPKEEW